MVPSMQYWWSTIFAKGLGVVLTHVTSVPSFAVGAARVADPLLPPLCGWAIARPTADNDHDEIVTTVTALHDDGCPWRLPATTAAVTTTTHDDLDSRPLSARPAAAAAAGAGRWRSSGCRWCSFCRCCCRLLLLLMAAADAGAGASACPVTHRSVPVCQFSTTGARCCCCVASGAASVEPLLLLGGGGGRGAVTNARGVRGSVAVGGALFWGELSCVVVWVLCC